MMSANLSDLIFREPASGLLFAELLCLWSVSHYLIARDKVSEIAANGQICKVDFRQNPKWLASVIARALACALASAAMTTFTSWTLVGVVLTGTLALPLLRAVIDPNYIAELEIGANVAFATVLITLVDRSHLALTWAPLKLDVANSRITLTTLIVAIVLFSLRGGTYIVRGVLDKTGALPKLRESAAPTAASTLTVADTTIPMAMTKITTITAAEWEEPAQEERPRQEQTSTVRIDTKEYGRGRLIGNLERLLLIVIVVAGSYPSLGFLAAAKGLIRSKDLENRDWAEYFLVGSLTSVLVAIAAGLLIQRLLALLAEAR